MIALNHHQHLKVRLVDIRNPTRPKQLEAPGSRVFWLMGTASAASIQGQWMRRSGRYRVRKEWSKGLVGYAGYLGITLLQGGIWRSYLGPYRADSAKWSKVCAGVYCPNRNRRSTWACLTRTPAQAPDFSWGFQPLHSNHHQNIVEKHGKR